MSGGKRPTKLAPDTPTVKSTVLVDKLYKASLTRRLLLRSGVLNRRVGAGLLFCLGFVGGTCVALFQLHVAVRGQTFYDFIERKGARFMWEEMSERERRDLLVKHGKEHLIEGLNL